MSKKGGFLLGALIGGTAAAVTALLLAPESGKELRDKLAKQVDDLLDQASDYKEVSKETSHDFADLAKEKMSTYAKRLEELAKQLKENMAETAEEVIDFSEESIAEIKEEVAEIKQAFSEGLTEITEEEDVQDIVIELTDPLAEEATPTEEGLAEVPLEELEELKEVLEENNPEDEHEHEHEHDPSI